MRRFTLPATVVLLLIVCSEGAAQQYSSAEDILRWFPQGDYQMIMHRDNAMLRSGPAYALYAKYLEPETDQAEESKKQSHSGRTIRVRIPNSGQLGAGNVLPIKELKLPPSLRSIVAASTTALVTSLADEPESEREAYKELKGSGQAQRNGSTGSFSFVDTSKADMAVHRFDDLPAALAEALKRNEIAETGRKLAGRPLYTFSIGEAGGRDEYFAWGNEFGELLVAVELPALRKMYLAGAGRMMSILEDPRCVDLVTIIPELGAKWSAKLSLIPWELLADGAQSKEEEERLRRMRERNSGSPILALNSLSVADELISRNYTAYEEDETAEKAYNDSESRDLARLAGLFGSDRSAPEMTEYQRMFRERREVELRGNMVVATVLYDEKLLAAERKMDSMLSLALKNRKIISDDKTSQKKGGKEDKQSGAGKK